VENIDPPALFDTSFQKGFNLFLFGNVCLIRFALTPSWSMMALVSSSAGSLISMTRTMAPSRANSTAVALPFPQPGPLEPASATISTLSFSRSPILSLFLVFLI
jgi:hypothetical protein